MAFSIHWKIIFKSLRAGTVYTVNIWKDGTLPSGYPLKLKGGEEPFTTDEDDDEDMFAPIRTQSGYFRIVDDGKAVNANGQEVAFDISSLYPVTATDRPVTLTDGQGNVVWQGFMQAQTFGSELYGNPQQYEFPIQCPVKALESKEPSTASVALRNFAYLVDQALQQLPQPIGFDTIYVQGGTDAQQWLLKKFDWQNFLDNGGETEADLVAKYNFQEMLEDMCKYWGWTLRTKGRTLYLTQGDQVTDATRFLRLTRQELSQLAAYVSGTIPGTTSDTYSGLTLHGDIFASTDNDISICLGYNKAVVKSDCNSEDQVIEAFPQSVEQAFEARGYTWIGEDGSKTIGYYMTPITRSFTSGLLDGSTPSSGVAGYFTRRQIYSTEDADKPSVCDVITLPKTYNINHATVSLQTKKMMAFGAGSLKISGEIYHGALKFDNATNRNILRVRIGVGRTRATAKWFYLNNISALFPTGTYGWRETQQASQQESWLIMTGGSIKGPGRYYDTILLDQHIEVYDAIPISASDALFGYVFIDFLGATASVDEEWPFPSCDIANFKIEYTRDEVWIPTTAHEQRGRSLVTERRTSKEYSATNGNQATGNYNVDCIFASDDNMKYGYGLLINADGSYMETASFGGTQQHPEQHLADRIAGYWAESKQSIATELRTDAINDITPLHRITMAGHAFIPIAISHSWRDDVTKLKLMEKLV